MTATAFVPWSLFTLFFVVSEAGRLTAELRARGKAAPWDVRCTGMTASWCPRCGSCTCRRDLDMASPSCSLHGTASDHVEVAE